MRDDLHPEVTLTAAECGRLTEFLERTSLHRAMLTVAFTDIEGSTQLNRQLGDARWRGVRERHFAIARGLIAGARGHLIKTMGDGLLIVFSAASDAVRFAIDFHTDLRSASEQRPDEPPVKVRIGLHAGEMDVENFDVYGSEVNRAARIEGLAAGRQTLASAPVKRAVEDLRPSWAADVDWVCHGEYGLRGLECDPEVIWEILDRRDGQQARAPSQLVSAETAPPPSRRPKRIGQYRLLQKIGEGGMGEVYEAEQERPVRRRVALKVIKLGMDTKQVLARFEAERQTLALMNHPNVAKVFDAGEDERGRPYFVMEYVKGVPITEHCDRQRLTSSERLKLFQQVCDGVQHAHQKAIIHRDIKPSNALVAMQDGKAVLKIIDFGVAKATAHRLTERTLFTELGQMIGTPEYMSPEQAEMTGQDVDTRTDVYSLGVVLYELLVGVLPFDSAELRKAGFDEIRRKIREKEPPKPSTRLSTLGGERATESAKRRRTEPSTLRRQLYGDLDWITMKALEKDRARRYGSASELAADITHYLRNEPVLAGPPSRIYRTSKFVLRHKIGVAFSAVLAVLLVGFAGVMTVQTGRIMRARDHAEQALRRTEAERLRANQEATVAREVSDFLQGLFAISNPTRSQGETITARQLLDEGASRIDTALADQPQVQGRLMTTMAGAYESLGLDREARQLLEKALSVQVEHLGEEHPDTADTLHLLAGILAIPFAQFDASRAMYQRALDARVKLFGETHIEVASTLNNMAQLEFTIGNPERALELYTRASAIVRQAIGPSSSAMAILLSNRADILALTGHPGQASELYERGLALLLEKNTRPAAEAMIRRSLGNLLQQEGELESAQVHLDRALQIHRRVFGPAHNEVALTLLALARLSVRRDERSEGARLCDEAVEIFRSSVAPVDPFLVYEQLRYRALIGDETEALRLLQTVIDLGLGNARYLLADPDLAALRGLPEFEAIMAAPRKRVAGG